MLARRKAYTTWMRFTSSLPHGRTQPLREIPHPKRKLSEFGELRESVRARVVRASETEVAARKLLDRWFTRAISSDGQPSERLVGRFGRPKQELAPLLPAVPESRG